VAWVIYNGAQISKSALTSKPNECNAAYGFQVGAGYNVNVPWETSVTKTGP